MDGRERLMPPNETDTWRYDLCVLRGLPPSLTHLHKVGVDHNEITQNVVRPDLHLQESDV